METYEATFTDSHLIDLDLDKYVDDFNRRVIGAYQEGNASAILPADLGVARSLIPAGTGALRDFSYIAPEIPEFDFEKCVGCMSCVTECPDTAILGKAMPESAVNKALSEIADESERSWVGVIGRAPRSTSRCRRKKAPKARCSVFLSTRPSARAARSACMCATSSIITRSRWSPKSDETLPRYRSAFNHFRKVGPTPAAYINEKALADFMLAESARCFMSAAPALAWGAARPRRSA